MPKPNTPEDEPDETPDEPQDALALAQQRIDALQARIDEGLTGERQWTETQIAQFRQELTDLRATLTTLAEALPKDQELREQLTQMQQDMQGMRAQIQTISPPLSPTPPPPPKEKEGGPKDQPANNRTRPKRLL